MPNFEDVTPAVIWSSVPQRDIEKYEKRGVRNYFLHVEFSTCFLKRREGGCGLPPGVNVTQSRSWAVKKAQSGEGCSSAAAIRCVVMGNREDNSR